MPTPGRLRVASYNIHECVGGDGRRDPARIAAVLREIDADIIGLQEVDARPGETSESMQMQYLAATLGHHAVAGTDVAAGGRRIRQRLLTRRPVLDVRHVDLTVYRREPRGALDVDLDIDGRRCACWSRTWACCRANGARRCAACSISSASTVPTSSSCAATSTNGSRSGGPCAGCTRAWDGPPPSRRFLPHFRYSRSIASGFTRTRRWQR